jgi:predicted esterase YcpF (UPF0227 family)
MIVYLHGFNSSPRSQKAQLLGEYLREHGRGVRFVCPALSPMPQEAISTVEASIADQAPGQVTLIGSSLGGFYATYLAEKHAMRAVLINPAIDPHVGLRAYLGAQTNLHTGEQYELAETHLRQWEKLVVAHVHPERYLLLVETGDEVLDYRQAVKKYRGASQIVVQGGDHSLASFPEHLPTILSFSAKKQPV